MGEGSKLVSALEAALRVYAEDKQRGSAEALIAVIAHLREIKIDARLRAPLYSLLGDLADSEKRENAEKAVKDALDGATAVAAVDLCKRAGDSIETVAIPKVSRATGGTLTVAQLLNLRKNMNKARGAKYALANTHRRTILQSAAARGNDLSAREIADRAIEMVRDRFVPTPKG